MVSPEVRSSLPVYKETGRYRRFIGDTHELRGTLLKSCPCGQRRDCVAEQSTVRQFRCRGHERAQTIRTDEIVCIRFSVFLKLRILRFPDLAFWIFEVFALYNAMGTHCLWPGMTPVSGR